MFSSVLVYSSLRKFGLHRCHTLTHKHSNPRHYKNMNLNRKKEEKKEGGGGGLGGPMAINSSITI